MRIALLFAAFLLVPSAAEAAKLDVSPGLFSPRTGAVAIQATLSKQQRVGVALATPMGKRLGWLARPSVRQSVGFSWSGRLRGKLVADGRYLIQLVRKRRKLASAPVVIDATPPGVADLTVVSGDKPFAGDRRLFAAVSPNGDGFRDEAIVKFTLLERATVRLEVAQTRKTVTRILSTQEVLLGRGSHRLVWTPERQTLPRTYLLRLSVLDKLGNRRLFGGDRPGSSRPGPVVRILGIDAGFLRRSYAPGQRARLVISTDARRMSIQLFHAGPEAEPTFQNHTFKGVAVQPPGRLDWRKKGNRPSSIWIRVGDWPSGLYYARLIARDGTRGFAPFIVRPAVFGTSRVAVVLPTNTWQAYNFRDGDGDGWGDTWYATDRIGSVDLTRPHLFRGVPYRFRSYDLGFLRWLYQTGKQVDFLADDDLERFVSGEELAALYDLIVFSGHEEYVTAHAYDLIERYRDLGGNLMFLSANNFFWQVERRGQRLFRGRLWRELGRPEARVIGVQYLGNDSGTRQAPFVVMGADALPWAFAGTGLQNGDTFGLYGIEIDAPTVDTPPGTSVLAAMPDVFGPGRTAHMTYYETPAGAKVFAAGALNFGGSAWPVGRVQEPAIPILIENLWQRLSVP